MTIPDESRTPPDDTQHDGAPAPDLVARAAEVAPKPRQLAWQQQELTAFVHFTVNTFTDREWGDGTESPRIFNPTDCDPEQWARVLKQAGFKTLILTAKHHDGFCLWPSRHTDHTIAHSPYRDGNGDLVRETVEACRKAGLRFGVYLSPWDRHDERYGTERYNEFYLAQLHELLTGYGDVHQLWLDGAKGDDAADMAYDWGEIFRTARSLQPGIVIKEAGDPQAGYVFEEPGTDLPDIRWVGNENGFARESEWSVIPVQGPALAVDARASDLGSRAKLKGARRLLWWPAEADVSIRPGWFHHDSENERLKSLGELLDIYYRSVGSNAVLLLNVPPDRRGLLHESDVKRLRQFRKAREQTFASDLAAKATVQPDCPAAAGLAARHLVDPDPQTFWTPAEDQTCPTIDIILPAEARFDRVLLQEKITYGQRIEAFEVHIDSGGDWQCLATGTTIGYKKLLRTRAAQTRRVRILIREARAAPVLSRVALFKCGPLEASASTSDGTA